MSKTVRTYIQLPDDIHRYLSGVAHEQSTATGRRVSISTVCTGILQVAVEEMRRVDAARGGAA